VPTLKIGDPAPDFTLPAGDGTDFSLKDFRGKKVVLYFYPRDNTPGCTKEACSFRDDIRKFERKGAVIVGVSADSVESHKKFAGKFDLPFTLVSDEKKSVINAYGVWRKKSLYGRTFLGIERTTFVIDERGTIAGIYRKVKVDGHSDEILAAL
jgi:peroxiredoxin Q/BCP